MPLKLAGLMKTPSAESRCRENHAVKADAASASVSNIGNASSGRGKHLDSWFSLHVLLLRSGKADVGKTMQKKQTASVSAGMGYEKTPERRNMQMYGISRCNKRQMHVFAYSLKKDLQVIDAELDNGKGSTEVVNKRMEVVNSLHRINKIHTSELAQKAKIKWLEELESNVSKEELKRAVWECRVDKSPRPDGFSFGFYRHFWSTIENDVLEAVNHFLTHGDIPKGCNSSFIVLIPKVLNANMVKDFRPISLIGSIYKIIAKILANRLVNVLDDIVNEVQSAFIAERQILDGPFIINEVMQWCNTKKKQAVIFKVDFEKAYDSVRWDFLDEVLSKFGFGNKWRKWIQTCLNTSRGSILVNGSPTEEFQFFKAGMFKGIELSSSLNISHLFFADDAMFVGRWCDGNIDTLMNVLECFHRASGLRINMSKSKIMGVHVEDSKVKHAASKLGCLILNTPFSYLGTKIGGGVMSRVEAWKEVVDKVMVRVKMKDPSMDHSMRHKVRGGAEQSQLNVLYELLKKVNLVPQADRHIWSLDSFKVYTVASMAASC
ncbi:RNA-directed DNA polymerase, eukaryota [Tanacetum coccineum]